MSLRGRAALALVLAWTLAGAAVAQSPAPALVPIAPNVWLVRSPIGNAVATLAPGRGWALVGPVMTAQQPTLLRELTAHAPLPVRFVVVGASAGLEHNRDAGWSAAGALVIAEEHAAYRMSQGLAADFPRGDPPASVPTTPTLGFSEVQQIHLGGEDIHVVRQKPGSSDADVSAHIESAGVIYLGDAFIADGYPTIDVAHGGNVDGLVETASRFMTWPMKTKIVPGRGAVSTPADLRAYHDMLVAVRDRVRALKRAGRPLPAVLAAHPTASFDARWGTVDRGAANALVTAIYTVAPARSTAK